jgi:ATP-dependent DNA helicase RecQ
MFFMTFTFCASKFAHPIELFVHHCMNSKQPLPWSSLLKEFWGFDALRPHQVGPVEAICSGEDTIAVLPTGGGKSLCYQLPGLVRGGVTLVVSPLIALMQDQLDDLKSRGIHAFSLAGVSSQKDIERTLNNAERRNPCFLFASPEKLENKLVQMRLERLGIRTVAIDEAHCISEWGHDFRPSYRHLSAIRTFTAHATWGCFTATATARVVEDIRRNLQLTEPSVFRASTRRENLTYAVCTVRDSEAMLYQAALNSKGSGLIYVGTRYQAEKWAKRLDGVEGGVQPYHAGLDAQVRAQRLKAWTQGDIRIVVCTNAFGMGIDKPDVRWVYHAHIPANLESYVQEAGRAGRDGLRSECVVFMNPEMIERRLEQLKETDPNQLPTNEVYQFLANQGEVAIGAQPNRPSSFDATALASKGDHSMPSINRSLLLLQQAGYVKLIESPSEMSLRITFNERSQSELLELADAPSDEGRLGSYLAPLAVHSTLLRKQKDFTSIGLAWHQVIAALRRMEEWGVLMFTEHQGLQQVEWTQARATGAVTIPPEIGTIPFERSLDRFTAFNTFLESTACRQLSIAHYFGFDDKEPCGHCDNCLANLPQVVHQCMGDIPDEGKEFKALIAQVSPSQYNLLIQALKDAEENGRIRFKGRRIFKAD